MEGHTIMAIERYQLGGLNCEHCAGSVKEALKKLDSVTDAQVELSSQTVQLTFEGDPPPEDELEKTVTNAGYRFMGRAG